MKTDIQLRPMNESEFLVWSAESRRAYAADKVRANGYTEAEAEKIATESFARLLPDGIHSKDMFLYVLEESGELLGNFWFAIQGESPRKKAFIYDVLIHESHQGKGYGRMIMELGEQKAREAGAVAIGLHVFGFNERAIRLYQSLNYRTTDLQMEKVFQ